MKLTLTDIGRMAGVSRSTVSRVINDQDSVSPEVRERVHDVIERTGFVPNMAARSLASNKTGVLGLVIPSRVHSLFSDPYFALLIQGITRANNAAGTTLSLFLFESEEEERRLYPRVVAPGLVDGVILTASRRGDPLQSRLVDGAVPFVMVGRPDQDETISFVDADNVGGAREAAIHLCQHGYERIGYVGAPMSTSAGIDRLEGFQAGLATCGQRLDPQLRADGDFSERSGYDAIRRIMPHRPDAVFVASDTMAVGAMRALREEGISVPEEMGLVSFDGLPSSEVTVPALSTVRQPISRTGARAVEVLLDLVAGRASGPIGEVLPVELIVRDSCGMTHTFAGTQ